MPKYETALIQRFFVEAKDEEEAEAKTLERQGEFIDWEVKIKLEEQDVSRHDFHMGATRTYKDGSRISFCAECCLPAENSRHYQDNSPSAAKTEESRTPNGP